MISKKLATTLGTGALGASGAAGAAAWKLGMFDKSQNEASPNPSPLPVEPQRELGPETNTVLETGGQPSGAKTYFTGATAFDIKAVDSSNWRTETSEKGGVTIKVEEGGDTWQCTIKGIVFEKDQSKKQSINKQLEDFVNGVKGEEEKRKKLVENCAKARLSNEKNEGKDSTIELEVGEIGGNLEVKDLDNLLNVGFSGLKRFEGNYQKALDDAEEWEFKPQPAEENGELVVSLKMKDALTCTISGKLGGESFKTGNFSDPILSDILITNSHGGQQNEEDKLANEEKRKFLVRNCLENNKKIEGMKVATYTDGSEKKWKFENLEKEVLTKMYKNPGNTEGQQEQKDRNGSDPSR